MALSRDHPVWCRIEVHFDGPETCWVREWQQPDIDARTFSRVLGCTLFASGILYITRKGPAAPTLASFLSKLLDNPRETLALGDVDEVGGVRIMSQPRPRSDKRFLYELSLPSVSGLGLVHGKATSTSAIEHASRYEGFGVFRRDIDYYALNAVIAALRHFLNPDRGTSEEAGALCVALKGIGDHFLETGFAGANEGMMAHVSAIKGCVTAKDPWVIANADDFTRSLFE